MNTAGEQFQVSRDMQVADLEKLSVKCLAFDFQQRSTSCPDKPKDKSLDAFQMLTSQSRIYPPKKTFGAGVKGLNRKDEMYMYNELIDTFLKAHGRDFPKASANSDGCYITQVLCNALWYLTNQHSTINDRAIREKVVLAVPRDFSDYQGYNDRKRKHLKEQPLDCKGLESHSQALYSILLKPVMSSTPSWTAAAAVIKVLADCMAAYQTYLTAQNTAVKARQSMDSPPRKISNDATIEHRHPCKALALKDKYIILDKAVCSASDSEPVIFDETLHLQDPFETNKQRFSFIQDLQLTVPVDIVRFSPGGSVVTILCLAQVAHDRSEADILVQGARLLQKVSPTLLETHTRAQKRLFKARLSNIVHLSPSVSDFIYRELAMDGTADQHPVTQQRLRMMSLGQSGLVSDLRHLRDC